jgi:hypothetical protein
VEGNAPKLEDSPRRIVREEMRASQYGAPGAALACWLRVI